MFCKNCGTQLDDNQKFCPKCGTPVQQGGQSDQNAGAAAQQGGQTQSGYQQEVNNAGYQQGGYNPGYQQPPYNGYPQGGQPPKKNSGKPVVFIVIGSYFRCEKLHGRKQLYRSGGKFHGRHGKTGRR